MLLGALHGCGRSDEVMQANGSVASPATMSEASAPIPAGNYRVYVTNEMSGDLSIIDARTHSVTGTLPLGKRPRGIRANAEGTRLYVALSGSPVAPPGVDESTLPPPDKAADGIGVIDVASGSLQTVLRGFSDPEQLAIGADGAHLYIASEDTGMAVIADAATGKVQARLEVGGEPEGVSMSHDGQSVYVTSEEHHKISVIDVATQQVSTTLEVGRRPRDIAFSSDGLRAYVSNENDASITVIDASKHVPLTTIKIDGESIRPMGVVVSPDNSTLYVATGRGRAVVAIDTRTFATRTSDAIGDRPWGIALSPDGKLLYTANGPSNDISVIDATSLQLLRRIPVGQRPWGVVVLPD